MSLESLRSCVICSVIAFHHYVILHHYHQIFCIISYHL